MFRRRIIGFWIAALAFIIVFSFAGCEKLKISKLQSNFHFNKANQLFTDGQYRKAIAEYEACGFQARLTKPYDVNALRELLNNLLAS